MKRIVEIIIILAFIVSSANAQEFSLEKYQEFLDKHEDMSPQELYQMYPPGEYVKEFSPTTPKYLDQFGEVFDFSQDETSLLLRHRMLVADRISYTNLASAMEEIWNNDLPFFVSSDMFLHALHMSYDAILMDMESFILINQLSIALEKMHNALPELSKKYPKDFKTNINDIDIYLTVARKLLETENISAVYASNEEEVSKVMQYIENESPAEIPLFSSTPRVYDFSQMTVRGHYTKREELGRYFQSMMWLGRTEFYLIAPVSDSPLQPKPEDIQRQIIDAFLMAEIAENTGANDNFYQINLAIETIVGSSDNVQLRHIAELRKEMGYDDLSVLLNLNEVENFQQVLAEKSYAGQKILSQILFSNPFDTEQIEPASAFMLMGQRFIIDSYVSANVVYDKIIHNNGKVRRMLPNSMDILFAIGNDAAGDLLLNELTQYNYSDNLAGLRYLIDSFGDEFWTNSIYTCWLNSIRELNPPSDNARKKLPEFMQTAAWWQQKMNTQLASWAQLRHDNLLYAKQSYTGGVSCDYPTVYVEAMPQFYASLATLGDVAHEKLTYLFDNIEVGENLSWYKDYSLSFFERLSDYSSRMQTISEKEIRGEQLTTEEMTMLRSVFKKEMAGCAPTINGWYSELFYKGSTEMETQDYVVADVHTAPTDASGSPVGWVWHVGTGPFNLVFVVADGPDGEPTVFAGPVMSYYEHVTLNFKRLTDEEWASPNYTEDGIEMEGIYQMAKRPPFTDLYLADIDGSAKEMPGLILPTSIEIQQSPIQSSLEASVYPNPAVTYTTINFTLPESVQFANVSADIYDISGRKVSSLFENQIPGGQNYSLRWDIADSKGNKVNPGVYMYVININNETLTGRIVVN